MMNTLRYLLLGTLVSLLAGCGAVHKGLGSAPLPARPPFTIQPNPRIALNERDWPADAKLVAATILQQMVLDNDIAKEVAFSPHGVHQLYDAHLDYAGFALRGMDLCKYEAVLKDKKSAAVDLAGIFHLRDDLGRRTSVAYLAQYEVTPSKVTILSSSIHPIQPAFPEVQCFFVPETALKSVAKASLTSFRDWYAFAIDNAVDMTPTAADRDNRAKKATRSIIEKVAAANADPGQRHIVLIFAMDRILEPGSLTMGTCDHPDGTAANQHNVTVLNDAGWRIGIFGATIALDNPDKEFFTRVMYSPDDTGAGGAAYPVLVGLFSTTKNHHGTGQLATGLATTQTDRSGPLESGERFLNPKNRNDAMLIQARLAEMGFYAAAVDGSFGKGSRAALEKFQASKGLGGKGNWDLPTQQALFAGSGQ